MSLAGPGRPGLRDNPAMPKTCPLPNAPLNLALAGALACGLAAAQPAPAALPAQAAAPAPAPAASAASPAGAMPRQAPALERVEITGGGQTESDARRQSTASKIVIGRDELDRLGDTSVADVLKRLPGVTIGGRPGRGGEIRMRGLGSGYTQIMVNGERIPPGFSIDTLTPEQIERIEVSRAPTAETGARAIAGSINIVLREDVRRRLNNLQLGLGEEAGLLQPSLSWTRGDQDGDLSYNLSASVHRTRRHDHSTVDTTRTELATGATTLARHEERDSLQRRVNVHLGGRVMLRLGGGDSLSFMPFVLSAHSGTDSSASLTQRVGDAPWAGATGGSDLSFSVARATLQYQGRSGPTRYELRGSLNRAISDSHAHRREAGGAEPHATDSSGLSGEGGWSTGGKLSRALGTDHSIALGWEAESQRRSESKTSLVDGLPVTTDLEDQLSARTLRRAAWVQDEWNLGPTWSAYAGLRWEAIRITSDTPAGGAEAGRLGNRSAVWTPLLHSVWKTDEAGKDQIRFALTRSYRNPSLQNLVARPSFAQHNTATQPDRVGNPALAPELATGIDLAYEHYLSAGGLVSASVFQRRIGHLIRTLTTFDTGTQRWIAQPRNVGTARSSGVELEAKFRLAELWRDGVAPNVDLRSNLSLFRSSVSGVDGPDNRLDQQPRASMNLGGDWKLAASPLSLGGNYNWTPAGHVTLSSDAASGGTSQSVSSNARRVVDAYALWTFSPAVQLRLSGANLLARDTVDTRDVLGSAGAGGGPSLEQAGTAARTYRVWTLRLELKL
ncbi:MAG: hypothetical protein RLZZ584_1235 [Pseudomonadota bacterium]